MSRAHLLSLAPFLFAVPLALAAGGDKTHGAQLYQEKGCVQCHGTQREGTEKGPGLGNVQKRMPDDKLHNQIVNGGGGMPPFGDALSEQEVEDLIAFLHTKAPKPPKGARRPAPTPPPPPPSAADPNS